MELEKALPVGTEVRFTEKWLTAIGEKETKRYKDRNGVVSGYRMQAEGRVPLPIVTFPKMGRYKEERLFEVPWKRLELVEPKP